MKPYINWFFQIWSRDFRQAKIEVFETIMFIAIGHLFGHFNPKQFADSLGVPHQTLYNRIQKLSVYTVKRLLLKFMVKHAVETLRPVLAKSASTLSRALITVSVDNSVIDRLGKMLRCTWSWYSGRWKKVVNGQDLLGIVMSINGLAIPLGLMFCSKQGRGSTEKPELLVSIMKLLIEEFKKDGIDLTSFPITLDSWFVSEELRQKLRDLGFKTQIIAGKGNYVFSIGGQTQKVSEWKKTIVLETGLWGINVPFKRVRATSPTFGTVVLYFYQKNTTKNYYLMDFSENPKRGVEAWRIWSQHHIIECFWKILKSVLGIKSMRLQGNGLYSSLLIKVIAYLIAIRLKATKSYSKFSITQIMRKIKRDLDLMDILHAHFHHQFSVS